MIKFLNKIKLETLYKDDDTSLDIAVFKIKGQYTHMIVEDGYSEDMEEYEKDVLAHFGVIPQILFLYKDEEEFEKGMKELKDRQDARGEESPYIPYPILKADDYYSLYGNSELDETVIPEAFISGKIIETEEKDGYFLIRFLSNGLNFETDVKKDKDKPDPAVGNIVYGKFELLATIKR